MKLAVIVPSQVLSGKMLTSPKLCPITKGRVIFYFERSLFDPVELNMNLCPVTEDMLV